MDTSVLLSMARPNWSHALPRLLAITRIVKLATLADVRELM
jgi:hypothetical protein